MTEEELRERFIKAYADFWGTSPEQTAHHYDEMVKIEQEEGIRDREQEVDVLNVMEQRNQLRTPGKSVCDDFCEKPAEELSRQYNMPFYSQVASFKEECLRRRELLEDLERIERGEGTDITHYTEEQIREIK